MLKKIQVGRHCYGFFEYLYRDLSSDADNHAFGLGNDGDEEDEGCSSSILLALASLLNELRYSFGLVDNSSTGSDHSGSAMGLNKMSASTRPKQYP
jgi:hypothetical protein